MTPRPSPKAGGVAVISGLNPASGDEAEFDDCDTIDCTGLGWTQRDSMGQIQICVALTWHTPGLRTPRRQRGMAEVVGAAGWGTVPSSGIAAVRPWCQILP